MNYMFMDLEFNQPFNFENGNKTILVNACPFEIIQIGLVKMSEEFDILETGSFLIKPQLYNKIHPYVEKITGLTDELLADQPLFPAVIEEVIHFMGPGENVLCVWGSNDVKLLFRNILYYHLDTKRIPKQYINVQEMASRFLKRPAGTFIGLKKAVEIFDIQKGSLFHDALNDALYTAEVFLAIPDMHTVQDFHVESLTDNRKKVNNRKKEKNYVFDTHLLYSAMEREWGRKLSRKEKDLFKKAYRLGRERKFDLF